MKKVPTGPTLPPSAVSNPGMILSGSPVDVPKPKGSDLTWGAGVRARRVPSRPRLRDAVGRGGVRAGSSGGGARETGEGRARVEARRGEARGDACAETGRFSRSAVGTARREPRSRRRRGRGRGSGRTGTADDGGAAARGEGDARGTSGGDDDARGGGRDVARRRARHDARRGQNVGRHCGHRREFEPRRGGDGSGSGTESAPCCWCGLDHETARDAMTRRSRPRATSHVPTRIFACTRRFSVAGWVLATWVFLRTTGRTHSAPRYLTAGQHGLAFEIEG